MSEEKRYPRRRFFREGLRELLKPLSRAVEPVERVMQHFEQLEQPRDNAPAESSHSTEENKTAGALPRGYRDDSSLLPSVWLRPPGALNPDKSFRDTCSRCRKCVEVCPAQCIKIDPSGNRGDGAPFIVAEETPCIICEGLKCMHACPTGALSPIPLGDIDMGTAALNEQLCVRSRGEDCTICIDACPIGAMAIELCDGKVHIHENGCVGCGVCQQRCPTEPKSIIVLAREVWERRQA